VLPLAIDGSLTRAERFGGRGYLLSFFTALNPDSGPLLYRTYQVAYAGPSYTLQPHVEFLLRTLLFWYLACTITAAILPGPPDPHRRRVVFAIGALLWGFLDPLYQGFNTLLRFYLALTLPAYIPLASQLLSTTAPRGVVDVSGGVFAYENLSLALVQVMAFLALLGVTVWALTAGLRAVARVSKLRALTASVTGLALGLSVTEAAMRLLVLVLAPTGLL
jgi:hypothetical protein